MVFDFIESGINLFDDTFNTIKSLFANVVENLTPSRLTKVGMGAGNTSIYIRWYTSDTTYYTIYFQPTSQVATNKAYMTYYDGASSTRVMTFTVS